MTEIPILFDVDGVILRFHPESSTVYTEPVEQAFREHGVRPTETEVQAFVGDVSLEEMREICSRYGLELKTFWPMRERCVSAFQRDLFRNEERTLYADVSVLSSLARDHPLGFVSNNQHATIEFALEHFGLDAYVETAYGREPTWNGFERRKPSPHYIEAALSDLGTETALYVGDRPSDVEAANRPAYEITSLTELPHVVDRLTTSR